MPEISHELLEHMTETNRTLGRIEANIKTNCELTESLNVKIDTHIGSNGAHGMGLKEEAAKDIENKSNNRWNSYGTSIVAFGVCADWLWRLFHKGSAP